MRSRRGRKGGMPDRTEDATPCIKSCLRLLMRSAQAMSFSLFPFPLLPFKPFLLTGQCIDLQSKFKRALNPLHQQARTRHLTINWLASARSNFARQLSYKEAKSLLPPMSPCWHKWSSRDKLIFPQAIGGEKVLLLYHVGTPSVRLEKT